EEARGVDEVRRVGGRWGDSRLPEVGANQRFGAVDEAFLDADLDRVLAPRLHAAIGAQRLADAGHEAEHARAFAGLGEIRIVEGGDRKRERVRIDAARKARLAA